MDANFQTHNSFECRWGEGFRRSRGYSYGYEQRRAQDRRRLGSVGKRQNRDSRGIWVLLRPAGVGSRLSCNCRGRCYFSASGNRWRRAVLRGKLFRGLESLCAQRDKYLSGLADQHGRCVDGLQSNPARSSVRDVLSAGSAEIQSVSGEFHFHESEFSNSRIPSDVAAIYDPGTRNFQYALAQQANLTIEREITKDWKISLGYNYTHGTHLDRTINLSVAEPRLLTSNDHNAILAGLVTPGTNPQGIQVPSTADINTACPGAIPAVNTAGGGSIAFGTPAGPLAPSILGFGFTGPNCGWTPIGFIGSAAVFNFFRPSGPNPSFGPLVPGGYNTLVALAGAAGFPTGFPGTQIPWSDVNPQTSTGNSLYNAFTLTVTKRFSRGIELLSSWTYSHTIDDSTDLSTLLNPQDNSFPNLDRGNSDFDQRHRWITSAVFQSPYHQSDSGFWKKFLANFTVSPVVEVASGRPYNVLIGSDPNLDFG